MDLIKLGTKDGYKYGLQKEGCMVVPPIYSTREDMLKDPYFSNDKKESQQNNQNREQ